MFGLGTSFVHLGANFIYSPPKNIPNNLTNKKEKGSNQFLKLGDGRLGDRNRGRKILDK
jgi:hypothetical protein